MQSIPALLLTSALTAVVVGTATPARAGGCDGYVHNSAASRYSLHVTPAGGAEVRLAVARTWYGDRPISWVALRIASTATIRYENASGTHLRTDHVGRGTYVIDSCHRAFVKTGPVS